VRIVCILIQIFSIVLIARILLEWLQLPPDHPVTRFRAALRVVTDPVLRPLRKVIPPIRTGSVAIDLSPLVVFVALGILAAAVC
jgi:YggT family protein